MILTPEDRIRRHVADGAWTRVTIDQIFRRAHGATPDAVVFRDVGRGSVPGLDTSLTFAEAERRIEGLAAFFAGIGLKPDMVIGLHLPACADAAMILLAALRAGLIVCPLPLHWRRREIEAAVGAAAIKGIVTAAEIEDEPAGETIRDVAAEVFTIRFVFSVGHGTPDGLIDLAEVLADLDALGPAPQVFRRGAAADHVALVGFTHGPDDTLIVVPHSHNHLISSALAHLVAARIDGRETVLDLMHPASLAGLVAILTGLLSGGGIAFHHPTDLDGLAEAVREADAGRIVAPAAFGPALAALAEDRSGLSLVSTGLKPEPPVVSRGGPTVDLVTLAGHCLLPLARRADGRPSPLPYGPVRLGGLDEGPVLFETRIKPRVKANERKPQLHVGELLLSGAIVPDAPWPEGTHGGARGILAIGADGALKTGLDAEIVGDTVTVRGPLAETFLVAGRTISPTRIDTIVRAHPAIADAAVFPIRTDVVGCRLGVAVVTRPGEPIDLPDLLAFLDDRGCGALDRPQMLVSVPEIPRRADGTVQRDALFLAAVA